MTPDYLIVGAGLTGATIARTLFDAGKSVLVLERRDHIGGNCADTIHPESGIRYNLHGPHYFRTNSRRIWDFLGRFTTMTPFEARVTSRVNGEYFPWPIQFTIIDQFCDKGWCPARGPELGPPRNFEEAVLCFLPREIYDLFIRGYTQKQWGVDPRELSPALANRFDIRHGDLRLKTSTFQGIPKGGYSAMIAAMLDGIPTELSTDVLKPKGTRLWVGLIAALARCFFTGPIDEYFQFDLGRLRYRTQERRITWLDNPTAKLFHPTIQTNFPSIDDEELRIIEWAHLNPTPSNHSLFTAEFPTDATHPDQYEYPFPSLADSALYTRYRYFAEKIPRVTFCGRLGEYRYLDMDQAIARAMTLAERELKSGA